MHVVHVITKLDVGGAQTVVRELVAEQIAVGHRVSVITGTLGPVASAIHKLGADVHVIDSLQHAIDPRKDRRAGTELRALLKECGAELVHSHSSKTGLLGRRAARHLDLPSVYTAHGWPFQKGAPLKQRILSWAGETSAGRSGGHIVCVTTSDFSLARSLRLAASERMHHVPNGIGPRGPRPERQPATDAFEVAMVARFAIPKRHDLLIEALRLLPHRVRITFVGDGPKLALMSKRPKTEQKRVTFVGAGDPTPWLERADALALISDYEGLPMSILEGMRAALPVLANDLPGIRDAVEHNVHGILVRKTALAIANGIRRLAENPGVALDLGAAGHARWAEHFTSDSMASRYAKVYELAAG